MIHLYLAAAAATDLFSKGESLITKVEHLALSGLALIIGIVVAGHVARSSAAAAIVVVALSIIPAWILLNPQQAIHTIGSTFS